MIREMAANLVAAMQCFANGAPGSYVAHLPGVTLIDLGSQNSWFNAALLSSPVADEQDFAGRAALAAQHFSQSKAAWSFWICDGLLPNAVRRRADTHLTPHGLKIVSQTPGMVAMALAERKRMAERLCLRPVLDEAARRSFCHILSISFAGPGEALLRVYGSADFWKSRFRGFIGSIDGFDVTAGATVAAEGVIGVYALGTLPSHARRGFAETLVRHAIHQEIEAHGPLPVVLQATEPAMRLYRRLGFTQQTSFRLFSSR